MTTSLELGALDGLLGFHLRMASAAVARDFAAAVTEFELTQKQFAVLELVAVNPGASQIDIAQCLGTDRATMMAIVDRLEGRSLLERRRSPRDARRQELTLTGAGRTVLEGARLNIAVHEERFFALLPDGAGTQLLALLRHISSVPQSPAKA